MLAFSIETSQALTVELRETPWMYYKASMGGNSLWYKMLLSGDVHTCTFNIFLRVLSESPEKVHVWLRIFFWWCGYFVGGFLPPVKKVFELCMFTVDSLFWCFSTVSTLVGDSVDFIFWNLQKNFYFDFFLSGQATKQ